MHRVFVGFGTSPGTYSGTSVRFAGRVLSVAKLRVGQEAYQLSGVAQSLDDYYTGAGEAAGRWIGAGAERLGLAGEIAPDDLRAVLAGMAPGSGGLTPNGDTIRSHARRVPGFDLTFKTPKSVSVLYAVSDDPRVQGAIIDAGETAVRAALGWLEREAIHVRRGTGNAAFLNDLAGRDPDAAAAARIRALPGQGVVAATFRHRTSRAGDPLLHWHTLVANLVEGPDGRWSAFHSPRLYRAARAAGEVFQTVLRAELTQRLGLEWRPGRHVPEIAGVPQALCDMFSKRSREIEDWLEATGTPNNPAGRQEAVLATRRNKPEVEHERFDTAWKAEALDAGWGPDAAEALIATPGDGQVPDVNEVWRLPEQVETAAGTIVVDRVVDPEDWVAHLCRGLTETDSTFTRPQLVQAIAARIGEGSNMVTLERVVARVMASPLVVPVGDDGDRWTSVELLEVERRFLHTAATARATREPIPPRVVDRVVSATPTLGSDQAAAVCALAGTNDGVSVLVGPAGTGKTYTLDTIRAAYETAGYRIQGVAPSARAAHELAEGAHMASSTIHRLLGSWSRGFDLPDARTLLVVDEAAMAGIRDLETVVTHTIDAGGRVLLVGDHRQLPEVTAGGGFAALAVDQRVTVAELTVNRRQHHRWERDALVELRDGHVATAVAAYRTHDRVVVAEDRPAMLAAAVDRWFDAHAAGLTPVLIAGTNDTVNALNRAVRLALADRGLLGDPVGSWAGRDLAVGERVVLRINDYTASTTAGARASVLNGQTATITASTDNGVVVRLDHDHAEITVGTDYLNAGGVDHGYALTAHRAQGGTWGLAISVGADGLYREAAYLVLSRGRHENWLVLTAPELDALDAEVARHDSPIPLPGEAPDIDDELNRRLNTSRAKLLALARDPNAELVATTAAAHDLATLEARATYARQIEYNATTMAGIDPAVAGPRLERAVHTASHAAVGQTVKGLDRNNIGTIIALDDSAGTLRILFVATDGREAQRDMRWDEVQIMDRDAQPRNLTVETRAVLDLVVAPARERIERWHAVLVDHGVAPTDRHVYERAARVSIDRAAARLAAAQPDWLTERIGTRPSRPAAAQVWDDTVRHLAGHRTRYRIDDPHSAMGPAPLDPRLAQTWELGNRLVAEARIWLDTHTPGPTLATTRVRSRIELQDRRDILDAIFATSPADHRALIGHLQAGDTLPFDDIAQLLTDALAAQGERRQWILEHWPHVVEYAQITAATDQGLAGPGLTNVLDALTGDSNQHLARAANEGEPWLVTLASRLTGADHDAPAADVAQLLGDVASYRRRWDITHPDPLGIAAHDPEQAAERTLLSHAVGHAHDRVRPDLPSELDVIHHDTLTLTAPDDGLSR